MTATMPVTDIPDFNGEPVDRTQVKFTGVGTGFTGLDVRPVVMEMDDVAYFIAKASAAESASHLRDRKGKLVRLQRLHADEMAPIDQATAQKALKAYAQEIERIKTELDGQTALDLEHAAEAREQLDETGAPGQVAQAAKRRVENGD